jgi:outer membrane protein TolC
LHRAQSLQAHAAYDEQVAQYRETVLTAYQEVEDNLAALRDLESESVSEAAAVAATGGALKQSQYQYSGGLVTYLQVVVTENTSLSARLSASDIQVRRLNATVLLVKALGGGWNTYGEPAAATPQPAQ